MEALIRGPLSAPSIPYRAISLCPRHESARASIAAFGALNAARAVPIRWYRPDARTTYTRSRAAWTRLLRARAALAPLVAECPACGTLFHRRVRAHLCAPPTPPRYLWRAVQTARGPVLHAFLGEDARISACGTVHADRTEEARAWVGKCGSCSRPRRPELPRP